MESVPLLQHQEHLLQLCRDLGIVINWEKSGLEPSSRAQYLLMLIHTIRESGCPADSWIARFRDLADKFPLLPSPPAKMRQQLLGHLASLERFVPQGHAWMLPLQLQQKACWSPSCGRSLNADTSDSGLCGLPSLVAERGEMVVWGSSLGASSLSPAVH